MRLKGKDWDEVCNAVDECIAPEDEDLFANVVQRIEDAEVAPLRPVWDSDQGKEVMIRDVHAFVVWLAGLIAGSWSLPLRMPRVVLEHYDTAHTCPFRRCEDCLMVLPQKLYGWDDCPVCGGKRISWKKDCGPPWDPKHIYTPHGLPAKKKA